MGGQVTHLFKLCNYTKTIPIKYGKNMNKPTKLQVYKIYFIFATDKYWFLNNYIISTTSKTVFE